MKLGFFFLCCCLWISYAKASDRLFIGPEYRYQRTQFPITLAPAVSENRWGVYGGFEHLAARDIFIRIVSRYGVGKSGDVWFDHEWSLESNLGYTFNLDCHNRFLVTPFLGLAYYQNRVDNYHSSINEEREYRSYIPFGLLLCYHLNQRWTLCAKGQGDLIYQRSLKSGQRSFNMARKTNWVVELPIVYHLSCNFDIIFVPEYNYVVDTNPSINEWGRASFWGSRLEFGISW